MPHGRGGLERRACEAHIVNVNGMRIIMIHAHWTTPFFPKSASDSSPIGRLFCLSGDDHDPNGGPESGTRPAPGTAPQPPHLVTQTQARDPFLSSRTALDPASHRWHVWTALHSGPNATASKCWHVHFAQASARTHLAIGEPKPHRGPAHLGLARCGSTTADVNAWSTPHTTSSLDELDHRNLLSA